MSGHIEPYDTRYFKYENDHDYRAKGILKSLEFQWNSPHLKKFLIFKIAAVLILLIVLIVNSAVNLVHYSGGVDCYRDILQEWLLPVTLYFTEHVSFRNVMIIVCSFLIDITMIIISIRWFFYAKSLRLILLVISFYIIRGLVQRIFYLGFPEHFIFLDPGWFSPSVPYFVANDFFFSGHCGICFMFYLEFRKDKVVSMQWVQLITLILNFFCLLVTRAHFIIDLTCGIMFAHYFYRTAIWLEAKHLKATGDDDDFSSEPKKVEDDKEAF